MLHLIHDPDEDNYLLLETQGHDTAFLYRDDHNTNNCWLPLLDHLTSTKHEDRDPENFRKWRARVKFSFIYSARTLSAIHKFINDHPELAI